MKGMIVYTVLSVINLIAFAIGISFLPSVVPIHFDWNLTVDAVGSPWWTVAFPAVAALISAGLWAEAASRKNGNNRKIITVTLIVMGAFFVYLGWIFFAIAQCGTIGDRIAFPFALVILLPLSLGICAFGNYAPRIAPNRTFGIKTSATLKSESVWRKTHRMGGFVYFFTGIVCAICSIIFSCIKGKDGASLDYIALIVFLSLLVLSFVFLCVYAHVCYCKEKEDKEPEPQEK